MQRELISIPKMLLYALVTVLVYVIQTTVFGAHPLFGYHVDLLPAAVTAAALLDGPVEGAVVGLLAGVLYDVGLVGMDGIYPIYFMLYGLLGGQFSQTAHAGGFLSKVLMNAFEMLLLGTLRYFVQLMRAGASFLLVLHQTVGGTLVACMLCFIVYLPMRRISRAFSRDDRWI